MPGKRKRIKTRWKQVSILTKFDIRERSEEIECVTGKSTRETRSKSLGISRKGNTRTRFEESCKYYESVEKDEGEALQADVMKYGLQLPFSTEGNKKPRFYEKFLQTKDLNKLLQSNAKIYKRCEVSIEGSHDTRCVNLDGSEELREIEISGRSKAGRVFDGDIVLVEVFNPEITKNVIQKPKQNINNDSRSQRFFGKILGIFERKKAKDIEHPVFVCTLDDTYNYLMRPVCKTVPKLHVINDKHKEYTIQVYKYNMKSSRIEYQNEFQVDPGKKSSFVFLVMYLSWSDFYMYPLGAVIKVIGVDKGFSSAMKILCLQHQVPEYYEKKTIEATKQVLENTKSKPGKRDEDREDISHLRVFTIDPEGSQDLDDALSVEKEGNIFKIGIHVADVSLVVTKDDQIDKEARKRACTIYPGQGINPYHMLPEPLACDECSLIPGVMKRTLSVYITVSETGKVTKQPELKKTFIKSCKKYTYGEIQNIINTGSPDKNSHDVELQQDILQLFVIAKSIRKNRTENGFYFFPVETKLNDDEDSILNSREAHYLVEEFLLLANAFIANYLDDKFPEVIPLRCQPAPSTGVIHKWQKRNNPFFKMVLYLQNTKNGEKIDFNSIDPDQFSRFMPFQKFVWEKITDALNEDDIQLAVQYICTDELHPNQCLALEEWISFQETAFYKCKGVLKEEKEGFHFLLQQNSYVHFTSPIRRYPDIIVHRLLHAALEKTTCPYSKLEVDRLCQDLNDRIRKAKYFQKQCQIIKWGFKFKQSPQILQGFVREVTDKEISVVLPGHRTLPESCKKIPLDLLHVNKKPSFVRDQISGDSIMTLNWLLRVYNFSGKSNIENCIAQSHHWLTAEAKKEVCKRINPHSRTKFIALKFWKEILACISTEKYRKLKKMFCKEPKKPKGSANSKTKEEVDEDNHDYIPACRDTVLDYSSELEDIQVIRQACNISMSFTRGQVVWVQMTAEPQKGVLVPSLQIFDMTKNIKHCLQHNRDPIKVLSKYSIDKTKDQKYDSPEDYLKIWLPIIEMEAVKHAVQGNSLIINGVNVVMESPAQGHFFLLHDFCKERDINFCTMSPNFILVGDDENKNEIIVNTDFLCIRSECSTNNITVERQMSSADPNYRFQWVLHGTIFCIENIITPKHHQRNTQETEAKAVDDNECDITKMYKISFKLHEESNQASSEMLRGAEDYSSCVELVRKSENITRIEAVLKCLDKSSELPQAIALEKQPPDLEEPYIRKVQTVDINKIMPSTESCNNYQTEAIKNSLNKTFSLIHGPPGTGKTSTGIKLMYLFHLINNMMREDGNKHQQVVFCGPNNKSVDLAARRTLNEFGELDIIRLYGNSQESKDYPIPGRPTTTTSKESRPDQNLKDKSVHHLIRQEGSIHASEIKNFDFQFKHSRKDINISDIQRYKHVTGEATQEELRKHDVIFCTTAVAISPRFIKGTRGKVFQLIIDEAGMCTEPESMAAIIATKAKQVVLIGDHKQLRPFISSTHAAELGLQDSLFERYKKDSKMLKCQYRMHEEICKFPSMKFYESQLETNRSQAWGTEPPLNIWIKKEIPMIFCHVNGEEECQTVSTDEGNIQSHSNKKEVDQVIRVCEYFQKVIHVNERSKQTINIMSQYNAQCARIREALPDKSNVNVNTVVASQGEEWDYVIFSTVRSLPNYRIEKQSTLGWRKQNLGFITDEHQINVALTRARRGLIIIGNKHLLSCDEVWKELINHYKKLGCVTDVDKFPPTPPVKVNKRRRRRKSNKESNLSEVDFYRGTDRELDVVDEESK